MHTSLLHFNCRRHLLQFRIFLLTNLVFVLFVPSTSARTQARGVDSKTGAIVTPLTHRIATGVDVNSLDRQRSVSHSPTLGR
jgi:hypothetical protein